MVMCGKKSHSVVKCMTPYMVSDVVLCSLYNFTVVLLRKLRVRAILCVSGVLVSCSRSGTCV